ncbi:hypothetical protein [Dapis sp. BLCC M126]|uniref:hypothetical protein n=1 Tax=Dapis sp. BLCC M126 TaxID=3400189 RepID=UPI003CF6D3B0
MTILVNQSGGQTQYIHGSVDSQGNKMWGEGFNCRRLSKGAYLIEFDTPFVGQPTAVCTIKGAPQSTFNISVGIVETDTSKFVCFTSAPDKVIDCGFSFIVFGEA